MTRFPLLVVLAMLLAVPAAAQTAEPAIDLNALGWGPLFAPKGVNTDSNVNTVELLVQSSTTFAYRVIAVRGDRVCAGAWFSPAPPNAWGLMVSVEQIGANHKLLVLNAWTGIITPFRLETPACP
jgi:opacity protein-like surface antigen